MTSKPSIENLLREVDQELGRFTWEGTFADYLRMVADNPSVSRLSHKLIYSAIEAEGVTQSATGQPLFTLFEGEIFGQDDGLAQIVRYFESSALRFEIRKRILLLLGPPASGKSSIVGLIKQALERYTRTDGGVAYAIKGCPMQEEPLHLIPDQLRSRFLTEYGIYIEGDLCPRCRYVLRTSYHGNVSQMPVSRVTFSEHEAIGIGYYVATNPNPTDASLLVGGINTSQLDGDRLEVSGKAFRLDGELNVANRGLMEFVEIFKADRHLLTTLLGLAQEQLIKMERFGSVYADEAIVAHSNEGDFNTFSAEQHSEALSDRLIVIQIPYNLRVEDEVKICQKMLTSVGLEHVHLPPLTLPVMGIYAVLSRLKLPTKQGMSMLDKLRLYDGQAVPHFSQEDVVEMRRHHPDEGMSGISPRYVMNRLSAIASSPAIACISPLKALDSLWQGMREIAGSDGGDQARYIGYVKDTLEEYSQRAIQEVQRAFEERFEQTASELLSDYLANVSAFCGGLPRRESTGDTEREVDERSMREMEKHIGVTEKDRAKFRREIDQYFSNLERRGFTINYASEPRLKAAIEARLFPDRRKLDRSLARPRLARRQAEWARRRGAIYNRLINSCGYCPRCAEDIIEYVTHVLRNKAVVRSPKNEAIEWLWELDPDAPSATQDQEQEPS